MSIGKRLRYLREIKGLTQAELGAKAHVLQSGVSSWESDRTTPNALAIESICEAFGIREEWLRTGEEPMEVQQPEGDALTELFDSVFDDVHRRFTASLSALTPEERETAANLARKILKGME